MIAVGRGVVVFGVGNGFHFQVIVRSVARLSDRVPIGESVKGRETKLGVPSPALLCDLHESERNKFANGGRNHILVHAVFFKMLIGARQAPVVLAAVVRMLNFEPR